MNPCQKFSQRRQQDSAHRSAFARVDAVLAKNIYSESEKTELWLTKIFGRPPGNVVNPKRRQRIHPGKSDQIRL
jgi:hypothetical protein